VSQNTPNKNQGDQHNQVLTALIFFAIKLKKRKSAAEPRIIFEVLPKSYAVSETPVMLHLIKNKSQY
jgi:hypothetical protein